jgi:hypothetical protein
MCKQGIKKSLLTTPKSDERPILVIPTKKGENDDYP